jgi:hypothetical protein
LGSESVEGNTQRTLTASKKQAKGCGNFKENTLRALETSRIATSERWKHEGEQLESTSHESLSNGKTYQQKDFVYQ